MTHLKQARGAISYTDAAIGDLTHGVVDTQGGIDVVRFSPIDYAGKRITPCLRIDTRPSLAAIVEAEAERTAAVAWRPDGLAEYTAAIDDMLAIERANTRAFMEETCYYRPTTDAEAAVKAMAERYPAAALWEAAEIQRDTATWSDPTEKISAAENCMEILRSGGPVEDAKIALAVRKINNNL